MSVTIAWKVYGECGKPIAESFGKSVVYDFSGGEDKTRFITILREDIISTNQYVIVIITRETASECLSEMEGQLSDGIFENCSTGKVEIIELSDE